MFDNLMVWGLLALGAAVVVAYAYERGRESFRREIMATWAQHRCRECGAEPRATLIHVSGCVSGWPNPRVPDQFPLPGQGPSS